MYLHTKHEYITIIIKYHSNQLSSVLKRKCPNISRSKEKRSTKSIQIENAVDDSSAVNLAHNYSATWDPSLSAKLRTIKETIAVNGYLCLSSLS